MKKRFFTLMIAMMLCSVSFGQQQTIGEGTFAVRDAAINSNFTELYNQSNIPASSGFDVYIEDEVLSSCVQDTWYSPISAVETGKLSVNFEYVGGELVYTGTEDIKVMLLSSASINVAGGLNAEIEATSGKNGVLDTIAVMPITSTFNGKVTVNVIDIFDLVTGDKLDFYFRQTSESGAPDITINKGRFTIIKIG